jgi:DNA-binding transcriptional ArsR family regulator
MSKPTAQTPGVLAMSPELMEKVAARFRALSDPNRLALLQLFVERDRSVNELAEAAGLSLANTSKHLAVLCAAGFITRRKEGTRVIYTVNGATPRLLCELVCDDVRTQSERDLALSRR